MNGVSGVFLSFPAVFFFLRKTEMCFYETENGVMIDEIGVFLHKVPALELGHGFFFVMSHFFFFFSSHLLLREWQNGRYLLLLYGTVYGE